MASGANGMEGRANAIILIIPTPVALGVIVLLGVVAMAAVAAWLGSKIDGRRADLPREAWRGRGKCCRRRNTLGTHLCKIVHA